MRYRIPVLFVETAGLTIITFPTLFNLDRLATATNSKENLAGEYRKTDKEDRRGGGPSGGGGATNKIPNKGIIVISSI